MSKMYTRDTATLKKIKSVAYSSQGSHTRQLDLQLTGKWQ